jgi:hypothetical protein
MLSLYKMAEGLETVRAILDGEVDEAERVDIDAIASELLDKLIPQKVENYCRFIRTLALEAEAFKEEEMRLTAHRKAREAVIERLKRNMQAALELAQLDKLKAGTFTVALQKSPPSVDVEPGYEPLEFLIPQPAKLDKRGLLEAIKDGAEFEGCAITQGRHLRIR